MAQSGDELTTIHIEEGELAGSQSWVYVWLRSNADPPVIYVGATGMHPDARAWLHLHHEDPEIGRVLHRYPDARSEPLKVIAIRLPNNVPRQAVREAVTSRLSQDDLLSPKYVGDLPRTELQIAPEAVPLVDRLVSAVAREHQ